MTARSSRTLVQDLLAAALSLGGTGPTSAGAAASGPSGRATVAANFGARDQVTTHATDSTAARTVNGAVTATCINGVVAPVTPDRRCQRRTRWPGCSGSHFLPGMGSFRVAALALLVAAAGSVHAGTFVVNPVRVNLSAASTVAALTVRNQGTEATVVQLEVVKWSQQSGTEVLEPTRDLLATPPIFTVPAGGSQIIRVGLRGRAPDARRELAYRLLLKEVPPPAPVDFQGLQMALHVSLPVFVAPQTATAPALDWEISRQGSGTLRVSANNNSNIHVQVISLKLSGVDATRHPVSSYLLPGQRREWQIKSEALAGSQLHLTAQTDAGEFGADVVVQGP